MSTVRMHEPLASAVTVGNASVHLLGVVLVQVTVPLPLVPESLTVALWPGRKRVAVELAVMDCEAREISKSTSVNAVAALPVAAAVARTVQVPAFV